MPAKLKVYRTPIGFHDAYVAAPSQAAALRAWGTDRNLFARGAAELVTDAALTAAPLAEPGKVIKVPRGSAAEQLAAAGSPAKRRNVKPASKPRKPPPRPSRAALDKAEQALAEAEAARDEEVGALAKQIEALERERRAAERKHEARRAKLAARRDEADADYEAALEKWREV